MMKIRKKSNTKFVFFLIAAVTTFVVWGIFFAQGAFSDIVTFGKGGDAGRQTYPAFINLGYLIKNHIRDGIDIAITNGSNNVNSDGLEWYFVYRIFALLGSLSGRPLIFLVLFFATHMFINIIATEWLCYNNFGMSRRISILVGISVGASSLFNTWFTSFFVIYSLILPLFYILVNSIKSDNLFVLFMSSLVYVVIFNTGYSTVSCFMAVVIFGAAFFYNYMTYKEIDIKSLALRSIMPAIIGAMVSFASLWNVFISMKGSGSTSLCDALYYDLDIRALPSFFFFSYNLIAGESGYFTFGLVWFFFLVLFVINHTDKKMNKRDAIFLKAVLAINALLVFVSMGQTFPFGKWFYEVPIFGLMHLRMRYLLVTLPFFYVAMGNGIQKIDFKEDKRMLYISTGVFAVIVIALIAVYWNNFDHVYLPLEIGITIVIIYYLFVENTNSLKVLVLAGSYILSLHTNKLYAIWNVSSHSNEFIYASIANNKDIQHALDNYVSGLESQEIYKYIALESEHAVPYFIMNNYGWYHYQQYDLCNYLRYPLHGGAINADYIDNIKTSWFDEFDWDYLFDTRVDFVVLNKAVVEEKPDLYNNLVIDNSYFTYLTNDYYATKVKKYIPRHYTGGERILEQDSTFDNGYFYSPFLYNEDIMDFETDKASYFKLTVNSKQTGDIQFSMNPTANYKYYIDGEEIEPVFDYGLAYFPVSSGEHIIEIKYSNSLTSAIGYIYDGYYVLIAISIVGFGIVTFNRRKRR